MKHITSLALGIPLLLAPLLAQEEENSMEVLRTRLQKWVETRQLISKEKNDWETSRMIMQDQADLLREEIRLLREKTAQTETEVKGSGEKLGQLEADVKTLTDTMDDLRARVRPMELEVLALAESFPQPLRTKLKPLLTRIPAPDQKPEDIKLSIGERFQNAIGVLNEANKFSREVHEHNETRNLGEEGSANVTVIYLGISSAFYVNPVSGVAGTGHPRQDGKGWEWIPRNELTGRFDTLMKMYRNEIPADFVDIPFEIRDPEFALPESAQLEGTP